MMNFDARRGIIEKLEEARGTAVITYFLPDRGNLVPLFVGDDALMPFHSLLEQLKQNDAIDLFIYTRGGSMMTAPTIVRLFREYAKKFHVLVPFRCHSAGTLITLGADGIVMSKIGQLSPVDPSTANLFNPILNAQGNPADPRNRKPISVEDVESYLNLAKERVGLVSESDKLEVFKELTKFIEPLALGNVNRVYSATRMIAKQMLSQHMDPRSEDEKIDQIVKALTETYPHDFIITRELATKMGLKVIEATGKEESLLMKLLESYDEEFKLNSPFDADDFLARTGSQPAQPAQPIQPVQVPQIQGQPPQSATGNSQMQIPFQLLQAASQPPAKPANLKVKLGAIESAKDSFIHVADASVYSPQQTPGQLIPLPIVNFKVGTWRKNTELEGMSFE